ncbi:Inner membrane protein ykgB [Weeksella virosa]|nr:Inner membrane protein ykgB [Weeksella virosa]
MHTMKRLAQILATQQTNFIHLIRIAIFIVMAWIGGLKAFQYEADGIVPFVINSPFMKFFYNNTGKTATNEKGETVAQYTLYKNPEGKTVQKNIDWHKENRTYLFSYGLGTVICSIGILVLLGIWFPKIGFIGGLLTFGMSIVTLSFLVTTPEVYVPNLGGDFPTPQHGFPYLSGAGRLVLKDVIMLAGGLIIASDSANKMIKQ